MNLPPLSKESADLIRSLGPGERDLFVDASYASYSMSLRHAKAYEFASKYATGKQILELGCGAGNGAVYLSSFGDVTAFDVESDLIRLLPSIWDAPVSWREYSGFGLPIPDASVDLVTSFQVIEHVADPLRFLEEIRRVIKGGGTALLTTPNKVLRVAPFQKPWNPYHVKEFTPWGLRLLAGKAGFSKVQVLGLQGVSAICKPERMRCIKQMLGPYWMLVPAPLRRIAKHAKTRDPNSEPAISVANPEEEFGLDSYWWHHQALYLALDILLILRP